MTGSGSWAADIRHMVEASAGRLAAAEAAAEARREADAAEAARQPPVSEAEYEAALDARHQEVLAELEEPEADLGIP